MQSIRGIAVVVAVYARGALAIDLETYTFDQYTLDFGKTYEKGDGEYELRQRIFERAREEAIAHNARSRSWQLGINHLSDLTRGEMKARMGFKPRPRHQASSFLEVNGSAGVCAGAGASCLDRETVCCDGTVCGTDGTCTAAATNVSEVDWSKKLPTAYPAMDQGACGSCWAVSAAAVLQMHADIVSNNRFRKQVSPQTLLSCTPNELSCGGDGGCKGATAELAFKWVASRGEAGGAALLSRLQYTADTDPHDCPNDLPSSFLQRSNHNRFGSMLSIKSYRTIEPNRADKLMQTLVAVGPAVASIAGMPLQHYASGVLGDCQDFVIDHAVVMMGFGYDDEQQMSYWKIRNSWGKDWGEKGYFRLQRFAPDSDEPCGMDTDPSKGVACKDKPGGEYPPPYTVCGACGILSDTAYPIGTAVPSQLLEAE